MADDIVIFTGNTGQPITDQILINGRPLDLTGASVEFKMRELDTDTLVLTEAATIENAEAGRVSYSWQTADVATSGNFSAWWAITLTGGAFDTNEFLVLIDDHAPGVRTRTGQIYKTARSLIPITWDALATASFYGDGLLQDKINLVKEENLTVSVPPEDEGILNIRVIEYLAKLAVIAVIPAGVDYWGSQRIEVSATGTNENATYINRVEMLWDLYEKLVQQVLQDRDEIEELLGTTKLRSAIGVPAMSDGGDEGFVTPNPTKHFREYAFDSGRLGSHNRVVEGSFWQ